MKIDFFLSPDLVQQHFESALIVVTHMEKLKQSVIFFVSGNFEDFFHLFLERIIFWSFCHVNSAMLVVVNSKNAYLSRQYIRETDTFDLYTKNYPFPSFQPNWRKVFFHWFCAGSSLKTNSDKFCENN